MSRTAGIKDDDMVDDDSELLGADVSVARLIESMFFASAMEESSTAITHVLPLSSMPVDEATDTDHVDSDTGGDGPMGAVLSNQQQTSQTKESKPSLFHRVKNKRSILALVVSDQKIYAGTQGGDILVSNGLHDVRKTER
ncbi:MAG: hypothetical protein M1830_006177 [Pleopsidium flavum]|nr:MAG: hypothetical protein M1830_006177 [Pleopsidium flavum]